MFDIVSRRRWYYALSLIFTVPGLLFILLGGLRPSVDFTGGTVWQVRYESEPTVAEVADAMTDFGYPDAQVRDAGNGFVEIRTEPIDLLPPATPIPAPTTTPTEAESPAETPAATESPEPSPSPAETPAPVAAGTPFAALQDDLVGRFGPGQPRAITTVGPLIGLDLIRTSAIIIIIGELFILAYLWIRFGFRFGTCAIIALFHDIAVVVGAFAVLGFFLGLEFDALFVTALLTIIGFSVHDTIVVFDRIRENRVRHAGESFGVIVNHSILQTLGRSINTSLTVVVTLLALYLLGPATIRTFTLALLIGVISGTYSSIFNASQLLVTWDEWAKERRAREQGVPARTSPR